MKKQIITTVALVCCFMVCFAAIADISGKWVGSILTPDGKTIDITYIFKVDGNKLTGTAQADEAALTIDSGKVVGNDITFKVTNSEGIVIPHTGKIYDDSISMDLDYTGIKMHETLKRDTK